MNQDLADAIAPTELADKGLFSKAAQAIDRLEDIPLNLRVLRAELEIYVVSPVAARARAESLLTEKLPQKESAACWVVVGHAALKTGPLHVGLRAVNWALKSAGPPRTGYWKRA